MILRYKGRSTIFFTNGKIYEFSSNILQGLSGHTTDDEGDIHHWNNLPMSHITDRWVEVNPYKDNVCPTFKSV